jgi:hypothetical protein
MRRLLNFWLNGKEDILVRDFRGRCGEGLCGCWKGEGKRGQGDQEDDETLHSENGTVILFEET